MNLNKLATLGLWDETSSGMNHLEYYSNKYAQVRKADVIQQTNRTRLYFIWEGAQTSCSEHLKGWPVLCCRHTGYVHVMNWFNASQAVIHYGSTSLCPYCALSTKALPAAGPKCAVHTWGTVCVGTEWAALVYNPLMHNKSVLQVPSAHPSQNTCYKNTW